MPKIDENQPISIGKQFIYSVGEFASNPLYTIAFSFLTFFYTDVLGINAGVVGIVVLVGRIFDGISDVWAGNVIDHTHTKAGSARPWILWMSIPMAISYIALFTVPEWGNIGRIIYIFVSYNFTMSLVYTFFGASMNALPIYITSDTKSRSSAYAIRLIVAGLIQGVLSFVFMNVVEALGGKQSSWIIISAVLGTIAFISCLITYYGSRENPAIAKVTKGDTNLLKAIKTILRNKYWYMVLGFTILLVFHQVSTLTVGVYYAKYILCDATLVGSLVLYHHMGGAVGMLGMPYLLQKGISKRNANLVAGILMIAGTLISIFFMNRITLIISLAMRGCGFGIASATNGGMMADVVDFGEWKNGVRNPAVVTSAGSFGQKLGGGLGTALFGLALSLAGYNGLAAVQTDKALWCIKFLFTGLPIAIYLIFIVIVLLYNLDKLHPDIMKDLEKRHKENNS